MPDVLVTRRDPCNCFARALGAATYLTLWSERLRHREALRAQAVASQLPRRLDVVRLYESYLRTFQINTGRH
jgi:hypothetical protein